MNYPFALLLPLLLMRDSILQNPSIPYRVRIL